MDLLGQKVDALKMLIALVNYLRVSPPSEVALSVMHQSLGRRL